MLFNNRAVTAGNFGGDANLGMDQGTVTYSTTEGAYAGAGIQMATMETSCELVS
jgi:hypothetical protein